MKHATTWILIADGGRARVLAATKPGGPLARIPGLAWEADLPAGRDLVTDQLPRAHDSVGPGRHAIEPRTDPREQLKESFVASVAAMIDERAARGEVERLIVVAPPKVLGQLRGELSARVKAIVAGEVGKDLTKVPDHDVASHLPDDVRP